MSFHNTPAFPGTEANGLNNGCPGLSMRDYFAAQVMAIVWSEIDEDNHRDFALSAMAKRAYQMADAMLKAREP